ncbi:hypothetical protein [Acidicapsa ligni]|uniref:hypothetical protein n=1 Tax=Acidicapsa ligni TaxID=542300 RepID=UPI0021E0BC0E|nr:hypothetical protein [Acidicapsa ligni]
MKRVSIGSFLVSAVCLLVAGCGGGKGSSSLAPQQPAGSQGSQSYTYIGTEGADASDNTSTFASNFAFGGTWSLTLDDTTKYFSYENIGHSGYEGINGIGSWEFPTAEPTVGTSGGSGFMSLNATSGTKTGAVGYALEVPGDAALLRPGSDTVAPVIAVETSGCPTVSTPTTYQFISFGTPLPTDKNTHVAYGSVQASNSGTAWTFNNYNMYTFAGTSLSPTALPIGNCGYTQLGYAVNIQPMEYTFAVSPSGYFLLDQDQGDPANGPPTGNTASYGATGPLGLVGVVQPSSAINTGSLVGGKYLGIEFDPVDLTLHRGASQPVAFGQTTGSGTVMTGGAFPNDDVTQTPPSNITIDLGQQDSSNNGLYKNVTVTVPDTYVACVSLPFGGTDANGNPTCTFHGVAVAGNPNGKFVLFVTVNDVSLTISHYAADAALEFFLYQQ